MAASDIQPAKLEEAFALVGVVLITLDRSIPHFIHSLDRNIVWVTDAGLNAHSWHDPFARPRCHMHIGNSQAHVPFPAMDPRLILYLICEHIEPDVGA